MVHRRPSDVRVLAGIALLLAGSWLPWYDLVCDRSCILLYKPGMDRGVAAGGMVILPLAVLAAVGLLAGIRVVGSRGYRTAVGAVAVALAGTALFRYPPVGLGLRAAVGVYLALAGGVLLLVGAVPVVLGWIRDANGIDGGADRLPSWLPGRG